MAEVDGKLRFRPFEQIGQVGDVHARSTVPTRCDDVRSIGRECDSFDRSGVADQDCDLVAGFGIP